MTRKTTLLIATAVIALAFAPLARADHRNPFPADRVALLAHELEDAAARVHARAEARTHHGSPREDVALARLHVLEQRAERFHRTLERDRGKPWKTERDLERLIDSYDRAVQTFPGLHADRSVQRDFRRVGRLIEELIGCYDGYARFDRRPPYRQGYPARFEISWGR